MTSLGKVFFRIVLQKVQHRQSNLRLGLAYDSGYVQEGDHVEECLGDDSDSEYKTDSESAPKRNRRMHYCPDCVFETSKRYRLRGHITQASESGCHWICPACWRPACTYRALESHIKREDDPLHAKYRSVSRSRIEVAYKESKAKKGATLATRSSATPVQDELRALETTRSAVPSSSASAMSIAVPESEDHDERSSEVVSERARSSSEQTETARRDRDGNSKTMALHGVERAQLQLGTKRQSSTLITSTRPCKRLGDIKEADVFHSMFNNFVEQPQHSLASQGTQYDQRAEAGNEPLLQSYERPHPGQIMEDGKSCEADLQDGNVGYDMSTLAVQRRNTERGTQNTIRDRPSCSISEGVEENTGNLPDTSHLMPRCGEPGAFDNVDETGSPSVDASIADSALGGEENELVIHQRNNAASHESTSNIRAILHDFTNTAVVRAMIEKGEEHSAERLDLFKKVLTTNRLARADIKTFKRLTRK